MAAETPHTAFDAYSEESVPQAPPGTTGKAGELNLTFEADAGGQTRLVREYARTPYHISGTLDHDPHPGACTVYLQSPTGGIAQGDRLRAQIRAGLDSTAVVSTQSATKVQSMTRNYAVERMSLTAESGSHLEYVPEPTILHAGARFARETTLTVADDASAVLGDVLVGGRLARQERFDFERYYADLRVEGSDGLRFVDATHLRPPAEENARDSPGGIDPSAPGVCAEFPVVGSLYVVAPGEDVTAFADDLHERVADRGPGAGATALPNDAGVLVRALASRAETATETLHAAWDTARRRLLGTEAPNPRRY
jgi:urease accessory protein